ncbi:hypothetical protein BVC93_08960 [Mycobacterium sp. MS1601]|uniref:hypothetical protein n=1 Tax=Mycobacterium sp. MS1601 TaxID=1936029 RepID=UPI0009790FB2|nr:hypothetical protein [Mycobacterium sp. MS1601]AQA02539.1 hypothetical protein BVC93_08960 [Mycobacterium sp. MS1601]
MDTQPTRHNGLTASRRSKAELVPITDAADLLAVANFLHDNHNDRLPWALACTALPGGSAPPNYGFMLRAGGRVVGSMLALYSQRQIGGRVEHFCNLGSWCVLPEYRFRSISLLNAALAQDGYHFTALSPDTGPREILAWSGFRFLDTSAVLVPNLPWPAVPGGTRVSSDPALIERILTGTDLHVYRDHARVLAAKQVVLARGDQRCHVVFREFRHHNVPVFAEILHVSDPDLLRRWFRTLGRHLLLRHRLPATLVEVRLVGHRPRPGLELNSWPKMYLSKDLGPDDIDYLYSELVCLPWLRGRAGRQPRR